MTAASNSLEPALASLRLTAESLARRTPPSSAAAAGARSVLVRQNAEWFCRLRWGVVGLLAVGALAGLIPQWFVGLGVRPEWDWPLAAAAVLAVANLAFRQALARMPVTEPAGVLHLWLQIVLDLLVLTAVVHYLGSLHTPAPLAYLFHVVLACIFFSARASLGVTCLAAALYLGCLWMEASGVVRPSSVLLEATSGGVSAPSGRTTLFVGASLGTWFVIWTLASRLATRLRLREEELAATNERLRASSEERMRHMLQTTHQLKAPFAAIHAQTQLLLDGHCGPLPESATAVVEKIAARSQALSRQIHEMLQLANLRSEAQSPLPLQAIDLAATARMAIERVAPAAAIRAIAVTADLASLWTMGVEDYLRMLLDNLLTNAVSYSHDGSRVEVVLSQAADGAALLSVRDHGIGIPADKLGAVFDDYYRTKEAVRHNASSSGLGLAIVRDVLRLAGYQLEVTSCPGWGTRMILTIPTAGRPTVGSPGGVSHDIHTDRG